MSLKKIEHFITPISVNNNKKNCIEQAINPTVISRNIIVAIVYTNNEL